MKTIKFKATYTVTQQFKLRVPNEVTEADVFFELDRFTQVGRGIDDEEVPALEYVDDDVVHESQYELVRGSYREVDE